MANRVAQMLKEIENIRYETVQLPNGREKVSRELMAKRLLERLMGFGARYHLVRVDIDYYPRLDKVQNNTWVYGNLEKETLYLTDITTEEARTFIYEFRYKKHRIESAKFERIPLNNPIKRS